MVLLSLQGEMQTTIFFTVPSKPRVSLFTTKESLAEDTNYLKKTIVQNPLKVHILGQI